MRTLRTEVERLLRECPDDPRVAMVADGLTGARYTAGEITKRGRPRGRRNGPVYRRRPSLVEVLWEPGASSPEGQASPEGTLAASPGDVVASADAR